MKNSKKANGVVNSYLRSLRKRDLPFTCLHEAGHAVIANRLGWYAECISVKGSIEMSGSVGIRGLIRAENLFWYRPPLVMARPMIHIHMAGDVSEIFLGGNEDREMLEIALESDGWHIDEYLKRLRWNRAKRSEWVKNEISAVRRLVLENSKVIRGFAEILYRRKEIYGWEKIKRLIEKSDNCHGW